MTEKEILLQMAAMKSFDEPMPQVGFFCFDTEKHQLHHVHKQELTPKRIEEFAAQGIRKISIHTLTDCTAAVHLGKHNGQVVWDSNRFVILIGSWAQPYEETLSQLLEKEFALPYYKFQYDEAIS